MATARLIGNCPKCGTTLYAKKGKKRSPRQGSVYMRSSDFRWVAVGPQVNGKRKHVYRSTRSQAESVLKEMMDGVSRNS